MSVSDGLYLEILGFLHLLLSFSLLLPLCHAKFFFKKLSHKLVLLFRLKLCNSLPLIVNPVNFNQCPSFNRLTLCIVQNIDLLGVIVGLFPQLFLPLRLLLLEQQSLVASILDPLLILALS